MELRGVVAGGENALATSCRSIPNPAVFPESASLVAGEGKSLNHAGDEESLVSRVRAGDSAAFEELVRRYQPKVFGIIRGILRDSGEVEELAQRVFTKVFLSIDQFNGRCSLYAWLYRIAVNECFDFLRRNRSRKLVYERELPAEDANSGGSCDLVADRAPSIEQRLQKRQLAARLLEALSAEERSLLLLKEVEGHSVEELAAMTGLNANTIKVKLFRARRKALTAARRGGWGNLARQSQPRRSLFLASCAAS